MEQLRDIALEEIQKNPYQPRKEFSQEKIEELAQSIRENGVIQPIILRRSPVIGYEILAGERRFRAAQFLGLETVPAIIRELSDEEMMRQAIIENLQREDLNPIEEAESYQNLVDRGVTHEEIAKTMGKSRPYISNSVRLLGLAKPLLEAVREESLSQGHARLLVPLSEKEQLNWLDRIRREGLSVRRLEQLLQTNKSKKKKLSKQLFVQAEEEKLKKLLGLSVSIEMKESAGSKGKIIIPFDSAEEYQHIINSLK